MFQISEDFLFDFCELFSSGWKPSFYISSHKLCTILLSSSPDSSENPFPEDMEKIATNSRKKALKQNYY
jgi:hypothetical protein